MSREVMQMALEALEKPRPGVRTDFSDAMAYRENVTTATNALREALAQPEEQQSCDKQETVAGYQNTGKPFDFVLAAEWENIDPMWHWMYRPLYASPPQRQPLTTEQYTALAHRIASKYSHRSDLTFTAYTFLPHTLEQFVRAIEAAHGIGNKT